MFTWNLKMKMILPIVLIMLVLTTVMTVAASMKFSNYNNQLITDQLAMTSGSLKDDLVYLEESSRTAAQVMSERADVMEAIEGGNFAEAEEILASMIETMNVTFFTVCSVSGNVLVRTLETDIKSDSLANLQMFKDAVAGKTTTCYEESSIAKIAVCSASPIYDGDGKLYGVMLAGIRLDTDEFVDKIKNIYDVEATVFYGDERVSTTIIQDGHRVVGTKLNPDIAKIVVGEKKEYSGEADILGTRYKTVYIPLLNAQNEVLGIMFMGNSIASVTAQTMTFIRDSVIIGVIGLVVSVILLLIIANTISNPIQALTKSLEEVADGKLNSNFTTKSKDEIGRLNTAASYVAQTISRLIADINKTVEERGNGDTDYCLDTEAFQGDYKVLAENIKRLVIMSNDDTQNLLDLMTEFNNGNFDADLPKMPGKKAIMNQRADIMRGNLRSLSHEIGNLTAKAIDGNLSDRAESGNYNGDWKKIVDDMNRLMQAITQPLSEVTSTLGEMSKGNLRIKVTGDYKGAFAVIKDSMNNMSQTIASYVDEISDALNGLANNDLNQEITRGYIGDFDNIKHSLNNIFITLNKIMRNVNQSSEQVAIGAKQMSESSAMLSQGAMEQASSIETLNATVMSVNDKTQMNTRNAQMATEFADELKNHAVAGNEHMKNMLEAMKAINDASGNISKIITIIKDIAFQTNLLALNASIEAAHAGVHGAGFSVVADEVRSLAVKSQEAANNTTELIDMSIQRVREGTDIAVRTDEALGNIVSGVDNVSAIISEIHIASSEQAVAISLINDGVGQMSEIVQNNSATSEENAAAAEELQSQSELLKDMIGIFKLKP